MILITYFPYAFGDWDNFDFNYPLYWRHYVMFKEVDPTTGEPVNVAEDQE